MLSKRKVRRMVGFVHRFISDELLKWVVDPRSKQGRRWKTCRPLLKAVMLGLIAGCKGLGEVEEMTAELSKSSRKLLGIHRRMPDTTLRDFLCMLEPLELSKLIYVVGYDAWRRKALHQRESLPFAAASLDGKSTAIRDTGRYAYLQVHHDEQGLASHGLLRTVTSTLVTSPSRPILAAPPIPQHTNEQGSFQQAFGDLVRVYGRLFRLVMYDAGAASIGNADAVLKGGKDYLFQIADPQWVMYQTLELLLGERKPVARHKQRVSKREYVVRELSVMAVLKTRKSLTIWGHAKTALKLYSETYRDGERVSSKTRYYVTSMDLSKLSPEQWLELLVLRWGVETSHQFLDTAFEEDKRPWITSNGKGSLAVMLLRRVAYTLLSLFKWVTLRSEESRAVPLRKLMRWLRQSLEQAGPEEIKGLRSRRFAAPPTLLAR